MSKKKKAKRKYKQKNHAKPAPSRPVSPAQKSMEIINRMKPIIKAAQRAQIRQRERETESLQRKDD